ncbi:hypothetical protein [Sagittula sp. S175]|uniref:hypothetical protein n=1 Tax=Sagittula sp. S175 TaxID=3415129 RepID=UPI003C7ED58D
MKKLYEALRAPRVKFTLALIAALAGVAKAFGLCPETAGQVGALVKLALVLLG